MTSAKLPPFDIYRGDGTPRPELAKQMPESGFLFAEQGAYLADADLVEAVNVSLAVGQPLLLTGEPGCGKTRLADSLALELGLGEPLIFQTRSTSQAQELLYTFDAVGRFHHIQVGDKRAADPVNYVRYGPLGQAIVEGRRRVVLIDEIDKAPRDFPNDLLSELDRMVFTVHELEEPTCRKAGSHRPVVVITSNSERQLPLAFLRRCVFHHIRFPSRERLVAIIGERLRDMNLDGGLVEAAVDRFQEVRGLSGLVKKPATGELLAWLTALAIQGKTVDHVRSPALARLPLWQALLKDRDDFRRLQEAV
ncbi:MAG: MoxR family ATPase [Magnetococcales bacterium]|nr:MoxR family ATPase [Magnetococcales bacterium]